MKKAEETLLYQIARLAISASRRCFAPYGSRKSRKDFTQPQLAACLVLRAAAKTDYRGVCDLLTLSPVLREALGLSKVPHFTTLQKCMSRKGTKQAVESMIGEILAQTGALGDDAEVVVDSTGVQGGVASEHYRTRRGTSGKARRYVKVSAAVVCGLLIPAGLVIDVGPTNDMTQMPELLRQAQARVRPTLVLGDKGYDAEWVHAHCREKLGAMSVIPVRQTEGKRVLSRYRQELLELPKIYGKRWQVESYFSGLKRTMLSTVSSRTTQNMLTETAFKVIAYAVRR